MGTGRACSPVWRGAPLRRHCREEPVSLSARPWGVVIDGEYYTRIVFQTITADTTRETFEWMLEAFEEARGGPPDVMLVDADIAMRSAADKTFTLAIKRRCIWHLGQNLTKNLTGVLGSSFPVSYVDKLCREPAVERDHEIARRCCPRHQRILRGRTKVSLHEGSSENPGGGPMQIYFN